MFFFYFSCFLSYTSGPDVLPPNTPNLRRGLTLPLHLLVIPHQSSLKSKVGAAARKKKRKNQMYTQITICFKRAYSRNCRTDDEGLWRGEQCAGQMSVCGAGAGGAALQSSPATLPPRRSRNSSGSSQAKTRRWRSRLLLQE